MVTNVVLLTFGGGVGSAGKCQRPVPTAIAAIFCNEHPKRSPGSREMKKMKLNGADRGIGGGEGDCSSPAPETPKVLDTWS